MSIQRRGSTLISFHGYNILPARDLLLWLCSRCGHILAIYYIFDDSGACCPSLKPAPIVLKDPTTSLNHRYELMRVAVKSNLSWTSSRTKFTKNPCGFDIRQSWHIFILRWHSCIDDSDTQPTKDMCGLFVRHGLGRPFLLLRH